MKKTLISGLILAKIWATKAFFVGLTSTATMDTMFGEFLVLHLLFFSPHVKRSVIMSNKYGIYEFPYELPNDVRLRTLGN